MENESGGTAWITCPSRTNPLRKKKPMSKVLKSTAHGSGKVPIPLTPGILALIFLMGFGPLLFRFFVNLWRFDVHRFFPLALAGAGILAWRGLSELPTPVISGASRISFYASLLFLGLLGWASVIWSPWLGFVAAMSALVTGAWWLGGHRLTRVLLPSWIMLLTMIPPPLNLDARLALWLQHQAVLGSSRVLALLAVPHLRDGNLLDIPGRHLLVEEACSGINSVLFMASACVFYVLWRKRPFVFLPLLYALTITCVLCGNLIRITSGAWLFYSFGIDLFSGWRHETLGLILTALYLAFIIGADALIAKIALPYISDKSPPRVNLETPRPRLAAVRILLDGRTLRGGFFTIALLLAFFGSIQLFQGLRTLTQSRTERRINPQWMNGEAQFTLPREIGVWKLVSEAKPIPRKLGFEDGVYSHLWQYKYQGLTAMVSLDYPFFNYHDVRTCYAAAGWQIEQSRLQSSYMSADYIPQMEVTLSKENVLKGTLLYSTVNEKGNWIEESADRVYYDQLGHMLRDENLFRLISRRIHHPLFSNPSLINYRIQTLASAQSGLSFVQRDQMIKLFQEARRLLSDQFIKDSRKHQQGTKVR